MRTQVGIIGAGPAGLLLSRLLSLQGIDNVVLENRSRDYVEARIRAGILEEHTVRTLRDAGVGGRLDRQVLECDAIAGADGFHGPSRAVVQQGTAGRTWERTYPYSWLGILADAAPATDELIYAWHPEGFALYSMRSPKVSRLYLQVDPTERIDDWSDDRIWDDLAKRFALDGWELSTGTITEKSILPMRSFVSAPMRRGRLFLAGDAAHIVPPTGAKGLNLAVADVTLLATALGRLLQEKQSDLVDSYSDRALARVWRCTHFSWFMTSMFHRSGDDFDAELQLSQLRWVCSSEAAARELAENYTGLPLDS